MWNNGLATKPLFAALFFFENRFVDRRVHDVEHRLFFEVDQLGVFYAIAAVIEQGFDQRAGGIELVGADDTADGVVVELDQTAE